MLQMSTDKYKAETNAHQQEKTFHFQVGDLVTAFFWQR